MNREQIMDILIAHMPEQGRREAYCSCGAPIGHYGQEFLDHLADVLVSSQPSEL